MSGNYKETDMVNQQLADSYKLRLDSFERILARLPDDLREAFADHFAGAVDDTRAAIEVLRGRSEEEVDGLVVTPFDGRYLLLYWVDYEGSSVDEINPDDLEYSTDSIDQAKALVEEHVFCDRSNGYEYRCRVLDLDAGVELSWYEVREVRWGEPYEE